MTNCIRMCAGSRDRAESTLCPQACTATQELCRAGSAVGWGECPAAPEFAVVVPARSADRCSEQNKSMLGRGEGGSESKHAGG